MVDECDDLMTLPSTISIMPCNMEHNISLHNPKCVFTFTNETILSFSRMIGFGH